MGCSSSGMLRLDRRPSRLRPISGMVSAWPSVPTGDTWGPRVRRDPSGSGIAEFEWPPLVLVRLRSQPYRPPRSSPRGAAAEAILRGAGASLLLGRRLGQAQGSGHLADGTSGVVGPEDPAVLGLG